jgi:hypothetical protein
VTPADGSVEAAAEDVAPLAEVGLGGGVDGSVGVGFGDGRGGMQPVTAMSATAISATTASVTRLVHLVTRARDA